MAIGIDWPISASGWTAFWISDLRVRNDWRKTELAQYFQAISQTDAGLASDRLVHRRSEPQVEVDKRPLREAALDEILRIIRDEEPRWPSARLSTLDTLPAIAANRRIEPVWLRRQLTGDWIKRDEFARNGSQSPLRDSPWPAEMYSGSLQVWDATTGDLLASLPSAANCQVMI